MSIKHILEQLELYGAKMLNHIDSTFNCQCRFSHMFTYEKLEDWCKICQTPDFQESLISEINAELVELNNNIQIFKVSQYGVATGICPAGHVINYDVDDIPNNCTKCMTRTIGSENAIWSEYTKNTNVTHMGDSDVEYSSDFNEDADYSIDSLNLHECTSRTGLLYESDYEYEIDPTSTSDEDTAECESCCDDWFTKWDNLADDDTGEIFMHNHKIISRPKQHNIYKLFKEFGDLNIDLDDKLDNSIYAKKIRTREFRINNIDLNIDYLFKSICNDPNNDVHTEKSVVTSKDLFIIEEPDV
jgi:hypothetical protein